MTTQRRRILCFVVFAAAFGLATSAFAAAEDWDWNYDLFYGRRSVKAGDWEPFAHYDELGVEGSWGKSDQPLLFATDLFVSRDREREHGFHVESGSRDLSLGFRKFWTFKKKFHPHCGAGISYVQTSFESQNRHRSVSERDATYGLWVGGGLTYRLGEQLNLGFVIRAEALGKMKLLAESRGASSTHLGIVIGWGSPERAK